MKRICMIMLGMIPMIAFAQGYVDTKSNSCKVWCKYPEHVSSITWTGESKNGMAEGMGTITWQTNDNQIEKYEGYVQAGKRVGKGKHTRSNGVIFEGNFVDDEFLNIGDAYIKRLSKNIISTSDDTNIYVSDGHATSLFYHVLLPVNQVKGVLVLLPGAWETTEHVMSSTKSLCELASDNDLAVIVPSVNQHITLTPTNLLFLNTALKDAIEKYKLPSDKFVLGGLSMGGHLATRYTELAIESPTKTVVAPRAIINVDGPIDLENLYNKWTEDFTNPRNTNKSEPEYGIRELEELIGGSPEKFHAGYVNYSVFSTAEKDGGNAKFLKNIPIRIYNDVDVNWWIANRGTDLYGMNALDQSAMINYLNGIGNSKAEFINALGKGYRLEGNRHPHSWSIVDAENCVKWVLDNLE